jgi:hypothetical protein
MASVPMLTGTHARLLEKGLNTLWGMDYDRYKPEWKPVFKIEKSSKNYEDDQGVYGLGLAPTKDEATGYTYDSGGQGFAQRYQHVTYGIAVSISDEAVEDNLYLNMAKKYTKEIMKSLMETDEQLAVNILNRAFNSSFTGADGLELCSTAHLYMAGGTYANEITAAALSETALEDMLIAIDKFKDERQIHRNVSAELLVIPPDLRHTACRLLKSELQSDTANNAVNSIYNQGLLKKGYHVMRRLSSTTAHFIITDAEDGLKMFDRRSPKFTADVDFDTDNIKLKGSSRRSFGWTDPHGIEGNAGA